MACGNELPMRMQMKNGVAPSAVASRRALPRTITPLCGLRGRITIKAEETALHTHSHSDGPRQRFDRIRPRKHVATDLES